MAKLQSNSLQVLCTQVYHWPLHSGGLQWHLVELQLLWFSSGIMAALQWHLDQVLLLSTCTSLQ